MSTLGKLPTSAFCRCLLVTLSLATTSCTMKLWVPQKIKAVIGFTQDQKPQNKHFDCRTSQTFYRTANFCSFKVIFPRLNHSSICIYLLDNLFFATFLVDFKTGIKSLLFLFKLIASLRYLFAAIFISVDSEIFPKIY